MKVIQSNLTILSSLLLSITLSIHSTSNVSIVLAKEKNPSFRLRSNPIRSNKEIKHHLQNQQQESGIQSFINPWKMQSKEEVGNSSNLRRQLQEQGQQQQQQAPNDPQQQSQNNEQPNENSPPQSNDASSSPQNNPQNQQSPPLPNQEAQNDTTPPSKDKDGKVPVYILFLAALFAFYMIRKRLIENNNGSNYTYRGLSNSSASNGRFHTGSNSLSGGGGGGIVGDDEYGYDDDDDDEDNFTYGASVHTRGTTNGGFNSSTIGGKRGFGLRSHSRNARVQEMVPISTANDDEWGWEDNNANRDMEMGYRSDNSRGRGRGGTPTHTSSSIAIGSRTKNGKSPSLNKDKEDLEMALALSLSSKGLERKNSNGSFQMKQKSATAASSSTIGNKGDNNTPTLAKDSWDDDDSANWEEHAPTASTTTSATFPDNKNSNNNNNPKPTADTIEDVLKQNFAGTTITSFSKPSNDGKRNGSKAIKAGTKKKEEDIFASMGLSSVPTKKATGTKKQMKTTSRVGTIKNQKTESSTTSVTKSNTLSAVLATPANDEGGVESGGTWDNDSDLDDLLED